MILPLLALFTLVIVQFSVVARDQLALWQTARELTRSVALAHDPQNVANGLIADGVDVRFESESVTVALVRRTRFSIAGFGFLGRSLTLRARVSMALEPPVAFGSDAGGDKFDEPRR